MRLRLHRAGPIVHNREKKLFASRSACTERPCGRDQEGPGILICSALGLDPLKLLASGALLIAVAPDGADSVRKAIESAGVPAAVGEVRPSSEGITIVTNGAAEALIPPERDEIARAFEEG